MKISGKWEGSNETVLTVEVSRALIPLKCFIPILDFHEMFLVAISVCFSVIQNNMATYHVSGNKEYCMEDKISPPLQGYSTGMMCHRRPFPTTFAEIKERSHAGNALNGCIPNLGKPYLHRDAIVHHRGKTLEGFTAS